MTRRTLAPVNSPKPAFQVHSTGWRVEQWQTNDVKHVFYRSKAHGVTIQQAIDAVKQTTSRRIRVAIYGHHTSLPGLDWRIKNTSRKQLLAQLNAAQKKLDRYKRLLGSSQKYAGRTARYRNDRYKRMEELLMLNLSNRTSDLTYTRVYAWSVSNVIR